MRRSSRRNGQMLADYARIRAGENFALSRCSSTGKVAATASHALGCIAVDASSAGSCSASHCKLKRTVANVIAVEHWKTGLLHFLKEDEPAVAFASFASSCHQFRPSAKVPIQRGRICYSTGALNFTGHA